MADLKESSWEDDCLLSHQEAAKLLGVNVGTFEHWRRHGRGPAYVKIGRGIRYQRQTLREYVAVHTHTPSAAAFIAAPVSESPSDMLGVAASG